MAIKVIKVRIGIEPADKLAEQQSDEETLSHIRSALYGRMGDFGWRSVRIEQTERIRNED